VSGTRRDRLTARLPDAHTTARGRVTSEPCGSRFAGPRPTGPAYRHRRGVGPDR
jgi:hypothetical protein